VVWQWPVGCGLIEMPVAASDPGAQRDLNTRPLKHAARQLSFDRRSTAVDRHLVVSGIRPTMSAAIVTSLSADTGVRTCGLPPHRRTDLSRSQRSGRRDGSPTVIRPTFYTERRCSSPPAGCSSAPTNFRLRTTPPSAGAVLRRPDAAEGPDLLSANSHAPFSEYGHRCLWLAWMAPRFDRKCG
jgi:hypothetical protein